MKMMIATLVSLFAFSAQAELAVGSYLSFNGKAALAQVKAGTLTKSVRLSDRTQAPFQHKVGGVVALVNSNKTEETRTFEAQIAANAYGYAEFTQVKVSQVSALSAADQAELNKYYSAEKIAEAKNVVTILTFKFKATK